MSGKLDWRGPAIRAKLFATLAAGAEAASEDMADLAKARAPVGKPRPNQGVRTKGKRVTLRRAEDFPRRSDRDIQTDLRGLSHGELMASHAASPIEARRFRLIGSKDSPAILRVQNGTIKGIASHGPHLIDTIHGGPAKVHGSTVTAQLRVDSDHAKPMEFGFKHVSHGNVTGFVKRQPYVRPAAEAIRAAWNRGAYFRKG